MPRIDVHHHIVPPALAAALTRRGIHEVGGAPVPEWDVTRSLALMDEQDISTAITSVSAPGVYFDRVDEACELARRCNEFAAELGVRHPGRFGSFAVLPMPFVEPSCAEAIYALDELEADGVVLLGSSDGVYLGDPSLEGLMVELDRRDAIVFVHPNLHPTSAGLGLQIPGCLIEFVCDTTRAALNLILTGAVERYPRIRWILAHAGGFLPYVAWRASLADLLPDASKRAPAGVLAAIRRFYFDTALSPAAYSMAALRALVEPSQIVFGSDYPFAPAAVVALATATLDRCEVWDEATQRGIARDHALALFPRYRRVGEASLRAPVHAPASARARLRRAMTRTFVALAGHLHDR